MCCVCIRMIILNHIFGIGKDLANGICRTLCFFTVEIQKGFYYSNVGQALRSESKH